MGFCVLNDRPRRSFSKLIAGCLLAVRQRGNGTSEVDSSDKRDHLGRRAGAMRL